MQAEETADAIVYLASDAASGVNGTLLHVNGGGYLTLNY
jgi:enoyl-[acyl-carrier-protein] reductase (NADH)